MKGKNQLPKVLDKDHCEVSGYKSPAEPCLPIVSGTRKERQILPALCQTGSCFSEAHNSWNEVGKDVWLPKPGMPCLCYCTVEAAAFWIMAFLQTELFPQSCWSPSSQRHWAQLKTGAKELSLLTPTASFCPTDSLSCAITHDVVDLFCTLPSHSALGQDFHRLPLLFPSIKCFSKSPTSPFPKSQLFLELLQAVNILSCAFC